MSKLLVNTNDAQDLLTPKAIKEHCGLDLDEIGTVKIYLDELKSRDVDVLGWTQDELFEDFKLWYEDDYSDDGGDFTWPEDRDYDGDYDPTTEEDLDDWEEDNDN